MKQLLVVGPSHRRQLHDCSHAHAYPVPRCVHPSADRAEASARSELRRQAVLGRRRPCIQCMIGYVCERLAERTFARHTFRYTEISGLK